VVAQHSFSTLTTQESLPKPPNHLELIFLFLLLPSQMTFDAVHSFTSNYPVPYYYNFSNFDSSHNYFKSVLADFFAPNRIHSDNFALRSCIHPTNRQNFYRHS